MKIFKKDMDIICIGEALIDFFAVQSGVRFREVEEFRRVAGGAPANVAVGASRLGSNVAFIGRVGSDEFGFYLRDILFENKVNIEMLQFDKQARTGLAFISIPTPTTREILFYRNPGADMRLDWKEFNIKAIKSTKILHFGSITLISQLSRKSTLKAVLAAKDSGAIISYDPNLRIDLWPDRDSAKNQILDALLLADIVKVNNEELDFITGTPDFKKGTEKLLKYGIKICLVTLGEKGTFYSTNYYSGTLSAFDVKTIDTTGCGDSFISGFLSFLADSNLENIVTKKEEMITIINAANAAASLTSMKKGVISSLPYRSELEDFMVRHQLKL
ncbi:MAG: PfkB family carbohydrate kinase [Actinobacteria bacterium]|nr:PfkB family carbohydrate kinase [Actinomycetota bacterium]